MVLATAGAGGALAAESPAPPDSDHPDVVFILADDIGWNDLSCYGGGIPTPNLDRLAREGMRFTDAHAPAAVCAPSRFGVMTGSNPNRTGRPSGAWYVSSPCIFDEGGERTAAGRHLTVGEILQRAGWRTAFFGKMHFGGTVHDTAGNVIRRVHAIGGMDFGRGIEESLNEHGFDLVLGLPSGIQHEPFAWFLNGKFHPIDPRDPPDNRSVRVLEEPRAGVGDRNWDTARVGVDLANAATAFIRESAARRFLLYYSSQAMHRPYVPAERFGDGEDAPRVAGTTGGPDSDLIVELDLQVGRILDELDRAGLAARTIVFFTSDNGAAAPRGPHRDPRRGGNGPFRGSKASLYEGGHRVPFLVRWGDGTPEGSRIAPGTVSDELVLTQDWVATMYDLAGEEMEEDQAMDSATLLPLLLGRQPEGVPLHDFVITQGGDPRSGAIRRGSLVLFVDRLGEARRLYDLAVDPGEEHDLIDDPAYRDRRREMLAMFLRHDDPDAPSEPRTTPVWTPR